LTVLESSFTTSARRARMLESVWLWLTGWKPCPYPHLEIQF
jgi:hypothetical protein